MSPETTASRAVIEPGTPSVGAAPDAPPAPIESLPNLERDPKPKKTRKEKKVAPSDVRPEPPSKFPWHKYPDATRQLCSIKDQLLRLGPDGKRVRGMGKLRGILAMSCCRGGMTTRRKDAIRETCTRSVVNHLCP